MEKEILINPGIMTLVSFVAMYLLLCTMIDGQRFLNQYRSTLNAGTMTTAMVAIQLIIMGVQCTRTRWFEILYSRQASLNGTLGFGN
ncbi:MAG TPA: hypothetical protein VJ781_10735 [Pyrinomonadaceae bacterium]|nr:hypothetical protein [Pyrinomonadaceae bacterium]